MKVLWGLLLVLFSIPSMASSLGTCPSHRVLKDRYIVGLKNSGTNSIMAKSNHDSVVSDLLGSGFKARTIHDQARSQNLVHSLDSKDQVPPSVILVEGENLDTDGLLRDERVEYVESDCMMDLLATPNDPQFSSQWGHKRINSEAGWEIQKGDAEIVVAISDTGIDYNHPDLRANMWINETEQNGQTGVDDDGNGCVDDIYGCDSANGDGDPMDGATHGTHVAGIVGAVGNNNVGVSGVAWNVRLMGSKGFRDGQSGAALGELLASVYYAADNGARVVNCSWGGESRPPQSTIDAFNYAISKGTVPVVAAGNSTRNASGFSPAGVTSVLTVGATGSLDQLATFSNFGTIVDVIAPGGDQQRAGIAGSRNEGVLSTLPNGRYGEMPGTSMASPQVAGLAALILSRNPNLAVDKVMEIIKLSGDIKDVMASDTGRTAFRYPLINVEKALLMTTSDGSGGGPDDGNPSVCEDNPEFCDANSQGNKVPPSVKKAFSNMGSCSLTGSGNSNSAATTAALLLLPLGLLFGLRLSRKDF